MTREEIINRIYQNSGISELGEVPFDTSPVETLEDYPYSLPAGASGGFNVPSGGSVGAVGAQSYGGKRGGGFGFPMLPNLSGPQPESAEEFAEEYANEYAQERAESAADSAAESAADRARKAERDRQAVQEIKEKSADITFEKPQIKTDFEQIRARGAEAVEEMRKQGEILRGERLSTEQMASAPEAQQMQFGRFADTARAEQAIRRANPNADAQQIKAKAEEIAEKSRSSAEPITQEDLQITYKDYRTPQLERIKDAASGTFGMDQTQVAVTGRNFADVSSIKNTERTIEGSGSVGLNNRNIMQRALDYISKPQAAQDITIGLLAGSNFGQTAQAVMPDNVVQFPSSAKAVTPSSSGGNVLQFPMRQAAGVNPFAGDIVDQMSKLAKPLDMSGMQRTSYTFNPVKWNADSRSVDAITSAAPKIPAVSVPSISSTIKSAAESVVSKLKAAKTNTQKLTTKEKRLGGL